MSRPVVRGATRRREDGERGFALIIFALMLFSLIVITAMVVDLGAVYAHRRNDQNAADSAPGVKFVGS